MTDLGITLLVVVGWVGCAFLAFRILCLVMSYDGLPITGMDLRFVAGLALLFGYLALGVALFTWLVERPKTDSDAPFLRRLAGKVGRS